MLKLKTEIQQGQQNYHDQECVLFLRHWAKSPTWINSHSTSTSFAIFFFPTNFFIVVKYS